MTTTGTTEAVCCTTVTAAGPFSVVATEESGRPVVLASGWTSEVDDLLPLIAAALRPARVTAVRAIAGITERVLAYHDGQVHAIDDVVVLQRSGPFLQHAWEVLRAVPAGEPVTYTRFAALAGRPTAIRAAGSACSRNAAALFVPCHRVLPSTGGVGSFRWGPDVKSWLLAHERSGSAGRTGGTPPPSFTSTV